MTARILLGRIVFLGLLLLTVPAQARDAAFLDPNGGGNEEAVKVDPKPDIDVGETVLGVAKRTSIFFVNQTNLPIKIEKVAIDNDANVAAEATANDCTKQGIIAPLSRCSVEISATPSSPGPWSIDVLMTHNGAGRITRAKLTGKTSGATTENKSTGLSVNSKDVKPVDFGDVEVGDGKIVRSTLMVNDSAEPITIYSIDVIEADNGLQKLDQGCAPDMELPPGASCPVTLLWVPKNSGPISTDLIIRHSGKMGFAVIPIRGAAKGGTASASSGPSDAGGGKHSVPTPPSAQELEKEMAGKVAPVSEGALSASVTGSGGSGGDGSLHLIGTVGERALILKPNGETVIMGVGNEFEAGDKTVKVLAINARSVDVNYEGKKKTLNLEAVASLVAKASEQAQAQQSTVSSVSGGKK